MAQTALPAPQHVTARRRAFFGLFNADGWPWAFVKALFWFVVIIVMLGYIPDRAYYFTVQRTVDVGAPGLVAGQPLPAGEPDAALPGSGRRHAALVSRAPARSPSRRRAPTARPA